MFSFIENVQFYNCYTILYVLYLIVDPLFKKHTKNKKTEIAAGVGGSQFLDPFMDDSRT